MDPLNPPGEKSFENLRAEDRDHGRAVRACQLHAAAHAQHALLLAKAAKDEAAILTAGALLTAAMAELEADPIAARLIGAAVANALVAMRTTTIHEDGSEAERPTDTDGHG